jgi:hypothetical protein
MRAITLPLFVFYNHTSFSVISMKKIVDDVQVNLRVVRGLISNVPVCRVYLCPN